MTAKVLIVDDELAIRDALGRKLRREGFDVTLAGDGLEGLRVFHTERPDVVVLDIVMPEMSGLTVCARIREVAETPVMMLSAQAVTEEDIIEGLNAGASDSTSSSRASRRCCAARRWRRRALRPATMTAISAWTCSAAMST